MSDATFIHAESQGEESDDERLPHREQPNSAVGRPPLGAGLSVLWCLDGDDNAHGPSTAP